MDLNYLSDRIYFLLALRSASERASAWVELNRFKWPKALAEVKPSLWDSSGYDRFKTNEGQTAWNILNEMTSEFDRSQAWWIEALDRTESQHIEWWVKQRYRREVTPVN